MEQDSDHHVEERPQRLLRVSETLRLLQEVTQRQVQPDSFHIILIDHADSVRRSEAQWGDGDAGGGTRLQPLTV